MKIFIRLIAFVALLLICSLKTYAKEYKKEVVIAIIDTGVDTTHPLIRNHLWTNPENKTNTHQSGHALHGWNFAAQNEDITDHHGHGTHVAGIILQHAGPIPVKLMILKYYDPRLRETDTLMNSIRAIKFATRMKVDIINYSGGGDTRSDQEESAIREAQQKGILFVAAAGNEGRNTDRKGYFPASYDLSNIISVAATDNRQHLLDSSNFGRKSVDIAAPGKDIFSSLPGGKFGLMTGTSQATAWVTGVAASIIAQSGKDLRAEDIKSGIEKIATKDFDLENKIHSQARLSEISLTRNLDFNKLW